MTTIREIARLSGSSVTTVSRVINHHPYVSEEKRLKIKQLSMSWAISPIY